MLKKTGFRILATLALALVAVANQSQAEALSALSAGSPYILVFVTSDTINAMSSTIGDYNTFVTTEANLNPALMALGTTWSVIGSTPDTNAIANIGSNPDIPIFDVNGNQIAVNDTTSGLFSGSLLNPILYDENGVANPTNVWTGTNAGGMT